MDTHGVFSRILLLSLFLTFLFVLGSNLGELGAQHYYTAKNLQEEKKLHWNIIYAIAQEETENNRLTGYFQPACGFSFIHVP